MSESKTLTLADWMIVEVKFGMLSPEQKEEYLEFAQKFIEFNKSAIGLVEGQILVEFLEKLISEGVNIPPVVKSSIETIKIQLKKNEAEEAAKEAAKKLEEEKKEAEAKAKADEETK